MWIFTKDGFYSAVEHRSELGNVIVRARSKDDIIRLGKALGLKKVTRSPLADYPYRLTTTKLDWAEYIAKQALEIDYPNFKSAMATRFSEDRMRQLHEVWAVMSDHYTNAPVAELEPVDEPPDLYDAIRRERS